MTKLFTPACSEAAEYYRATNTPLTAATNLKTEFPQPLFKSIDNRLDALEIAVPAITPYPGDSTAWDQLRAYNITNYNSPLGAGWHADFLDGHHGTYYTDYKYDYINRGARKLHGNVPKVGTELRRDTYITDFASNGNTIVYGVTHYDNLYPQVVVVKQGDSTEETKDAPGNITTHAVGSFAADAYPRDIVWHEDTFYINLVLRNGNGSYVIGYDEDMNITAPSITIAAPNQGTHWRNMAVGADGRLWLASNGGTGAQGIDICTITDAGTPWTVNASGGNIECSTIFTDGLQTYIGCANTSCRCTDAALAPFVTAVGGAGFIMPNYDNINGFNGTSYCIHTSTYESVLDGGTIGGVNAYILTSNTGVNYWNYQFRETMNWLGAVPIPTHVGRLLPSYTTHKVLPTNNTNMQFWTPGGGHGGSHDFFIGFGSSPKPEGELYEHMHLARHHNVTTFAIGRHYVINSLAVMGTDRCHIDYTVGPCRGLDFTGNTLLAAFNATATGEPIIYKDSMHGS